MQIVKADRANVSAYINVGIYGASGAGKTTILAQSWLTDPSRIVVGCTEGQAEAIVRLWNPSATIVRLNTYGDVQEFYEWLQLGFSTGFVHEQVQTRNPATGEVGKGFVPTSEPWSFETVCLDSVSDVFRIVKHEITMRDYRRQLAKHKASKGSAEGFDEPEVTSMQSWGIIQDKMQVMLRAFRNLPCNFVASFGIDEREEDSAVSFRPYLQGRDIRSSIVGFFNAFGYAYKRQTQDGGIVHEVAFRTGERWTTKGLDGCDNVEPPDFKTWHSKFMGVMRANANNTKPATAGETAGETAGPQE